MKQKIRALAIALLDDEDGINSAGYEILAELLHETENQDVLAVVKASNEHYYLGEDDAEDLRKVPNEFN